MKRLGEARYVVGGLREAALSSDVRVRGVARGTQVALHRAVPVGEEHPASLRRRDGHRQLGVDPSAQEFEAADPFVELVVGGIDQLVGDLIDRPVDPAEDLVEELGVHASNGT